MPIYWLGGTKVVDDYEDFYDGDWDDETNLKERVRQRPPGSYTQDLHRPFSGSYHSGVSTGEILTNELAWGQTLGTVTLGESRHWPWHT